MEQQPQAKFNAGVDTALYISELLKQAGMYARRHDFVNWHGILKELHRWVSPKLRNTKKQKEVDEVKGAALKSNSLLGLYQKKINRGSKINGTLAYGIYNLLEEYEMVLRKYIDKKGMQMPDQEDSVEAAWR